MKYLLLIALLVAIVITAGCVNPNVKSAVTSTPTPQIVYVTVTVTPTTDPHSCSGKRSNNWCMEV